MRIVFGPKLMRAWAEYLDWASHEVEGIRVFNGIGSSPFEMKWRESILWSRLNIIDLTVYILPHYLKF